MNVFLWCLEGLFWCVCLVCVFVVVSACGGGLCVVMFVLVCYCCCG